MFSLESVVQLKDDEAVRAVLRRHMATLLPSLALSMVFIVLPFFFLFPLFSLGTLGVIGFGIIIVLGIIIAARSLYLWDADVLILTTDRAIDVDQKGLLSRRVSELQLSAVQDVSWKREGIWQTVFRMGSLTIQTAGATAPIQAEAIPRPEQMHELINDLRREARPARVTSTGEDSPVDRRGKVRHIIQLLDRTDDETVDKVEALLVRSDRDKSAEALFSQAKA